MPLSSGSVASFGSLDERLDALWPRIQQSYAALGTPAGERLSHALLCGIFERCGRTRRPVKHPELHCKAAVARHCIAMLKHLVSDMECESEAFGHMRVCLDSLALVYDVIMSQGLIMTEAAAQEGHDALLHAGVHHAALCAALMNSGRTFFYMTVKAHFAQHIGLDMLSSRLNPRSLWTYGDEDYMGRIAQVCRPCLRGRGPLRLGGALMFRWRHAMFLRWSRRARQR